MRVLPPSSAATLLEPRDPSLPPEPENPSTNSSNTGEFYSQSTSAADFASPDSRSNVNSPDPKARTRSFAFPSAKADVSAVTPQDIKIYAGKLFDPFTRTLVADQLITVSPTSGLITSLSTFSRAEVVRESESVIDLRKMTVLPGFVDVHVHLFLHPYSETSWEDQVTRESLAERTIRATIHARKTLMAGYTAVRDLGTEGAEDADLALRKCLSGLDPIASGPRYFCATRAIVTTGSYGPKNRLYPSRDGVQGIMGAEVADGIEECIKAVRRQVGAGADWIKLYADYRVRANMATVAPATATTAIDTFTDAEIRVIVDTAHKLGVKVAAHSSGPRGSDLLAGKVDSVEHAYGFAESSHAAGHLSTATLSPTVWVPTLAAHYTTGRNTKAWDQAQRTFREVVRAYPNGDVRIACGGDTGVFAHGDNSLEMKIMVRLGAHWSHVLRWGTLGGWECIRSMRWEGLEGAERLLRIEQLGEDARVVGDNEVPFGAVRRGFAADIVATSGDVENDFEHAVDKGSIVFVMKGGRVYKRDGRELA